MADLFQIESSALPDGARVAAFRGREALSDLYRFEIGVLVQDGTELDLKECVGASATLRADLGDGRQHTCCGIFARFDLLHAWEGEALYRAVLVPRLWRATLSRHSRVFCDLTPIEAIVTVLELAGDVDYEFRLHGDYEKRLLICQYKESDYAFLCRWMEREGIHFYFEHTDGADKLIIADGPQHGTLRDGPVRYEPSTEVDQSAVECFDSLVCMQNALPGNLEARDFDYLRPNLDVRGAAETQDEVGGELDLYGTNVLSPSEADHYAKLRAEEQLAEACIFAATGRAFQLQAGHCFTLEGHPHTSMNVDYLVTRIEHEGVSAADEHVLRLLGIRENLEYRVKLQAIESTVQYRPPCRTPWPRIYGMERAFVDGPEESLYPHLDEHGRYKVKFAFDETRDGKDYDATGSAWVRMLQPYGGSVEGFHFPINRGTEVLLTFLGGDPDRPVIAGVVPNQLTPSPVNKDNREMNMIATSYANMISICDLEDRQYIESWTAPETTYLYLGHPEHGGRSAYIELNTGGNQLVNIGGQRDIKVGAAQNETVEGLLTEKFNASQTIKVTGSLTETVTDGVEEDYTSLHTTKVTGMRGVTVTGGCIEHFGQHGLTVKDQQTVDVGAYQTVTVGGFRHIIAEAGQSQTVTGWSNVEASAGIKLDAPSIHLHASEILLNAPSVKSTAAKELWEFGDFEVMGGKKIELTGLAVGATGVKAESAGVTVGLVGSAMSVTGTNFSRTGIDNSDAALECENKGIIATLAGLFSVT